MFHLVRNSAAMSTVWDQIFDSPEYKAAVEKVYPKPSDPATGEPLEVETEQQKRDRLWQTIVEASRT